MLQLYKLLYYHVINMQRMRKYAGFLVLEKSPQTLATDSKQHCPALTLNAAWLTAEVNGEKFGNRGLSVKDALKQTLPIRKTLRELLSHAKVPLRPPRPDILRWWIQSECGRVCGRPSSFGGPTVQTVITHTHTHTLTRLV